MTRPPRDLTDEELRRECELLPAERALIERGDKLAMVGLAIYPLLVLFLWALYRAPFKLQILMPIALGALCPGLVLSLVAIAGIGRAAERRATARARPYAELLADRHLLGPLATYVERARAALKAENAPDYVLILSGKGLPHGEYHGVWVTLWGGSKPRGFLEWGSGDVTLTRDGGVSARSGKVGLNSKAASDLAGLLASLQPKEFTDVPAGVKDGFPCTVAVVQREPSVTLQANCNLMGAPDARKDAPALRLGTMLWELAPRTAADEEK